MKRRTSVAVLAGAITAGAAALTGCDINVSTGTDGDTKSYSVPVTFDALTVRSHEGDVTVVGTDTKKVVVEETRRWTNPKNKPETRHTTSGGTLKLDYDCASTFTIGYSNCGVRYRIEVPRGLAVDLGTDAGDIEATGLRGPSVKIDTGSGDATAKGIATKSLRLETGSGDVHTTGQADTAVLETGSGSMKVAGLKVRSLTAKTGSGSMELELAAVPDYVKGDTGSGSVELFLPVRKGGYAMDLQTGSGGVRVAPSIDRNDTATQRIVVETGSGSIDVLPTRGR